MWLGISFIANLNKASIRVCPFPTPWQCNKRKPKSTHIPEATSKLYEYPNQSGDPESSNKIQRNHVIKMVKDIIIIVAAASTKRGIGYQGKLVRFDQPHYTDAF